MATASNRRTPDEAMRIHELKQQAKAYYRENGVPGKMEEILNTTFYDKPQDVYGHIANYFEKFAETPKITKVVAREAYDCKGQSTVQTEVYCRVKNHEKLISTCLNSNEAHPPESVKPEERDAIEARRQASVTDAVGLINSAVSETLCGQDPTQQGSLDKALGETFERLRAEAEAKLAEQQEAELENKKSESTGDLAKSPRSTESKTKAKSPKGKSKGVAVVIIPDEPREVLFPGCTLLSALSQAVTESGANLKGEPLYSYIAGLMADKVADKLRLPLPMVTILTSGKLAPGKLNGIKEFMVVPKPGMPLRESVKHIMNIYNHCAKSLSAKTGVTGRAVNDLGALWTTFDRPEQGLDLLQDAITQQQLTPGEDFHIALNCAAHEIFDYEKGKYEVVVGLYKSPEDLPDYWAELLARYPSVVALVDPARRVETDPWRALAERLSERCYVVGDVACTRPGAPPPVTAETVPETQEGEESKISPAPAPAMTARTLRLEMMNTVTDIVDAARAEVDSRVVLSTGAGETTDTFIADMAVGCGATFLRLGGPQRGERVAKLNRLLQIEAALEVEGRLEVTEGHEFPIIRPPTPPPEPDTGDKAESSG